MLTKLRNLMTHVSKYHFGLSRTFSFTCTMKTKRKIIIFSKYKIFKFSQEKFALRMSLLKMFWQIIFDQGSTFCNSIIALRKVKIVYNFSVCFLLSQTKHYSFRSKVSREELEWYCRPY